MIPGISGILGFIADTCPKCYVYIREPRISRIVEEAVAVVDEWSNLYLKYFKQSKTPKTMKTQRQIRYTVISFEANREQSHFFSYFLCFDFFLLIQTVQYTGVRTISYSLYGIRKDCLLGTSFNISGCL